MVHIQNSKNQIVLKELHVHVFFLDEIAKPKVTSSDSLYKFKNGNIHFNIRTYNIEKFSNV